MAGVKSRAAVSLQPILLTAGFLLLIGLSGATAWLVQRYAEESLRVADTLKVQDRLSGLLLELRRMEASQRGYLFSGNEAYLEDYHLAVRDIEPKLTELREMTSDDPARTKDLEIMTTLIDLKLAEMRRTLGFNNAGRPEDARALVRSGDGRAIMNALSDQVGAAVADEGRLLDLRTKASQQANTALLISTLLGAVLIITLGGLSVSLTKRTIREREAAQLELAATNENLERIVEYRTADLTEANDEIQRFAYIVSHDLRAPLVNIMGFTTELENLRTDIFEQIDKMRQELAKRQAEADAASGGIETLAGDFDEAIGFIKSSISKMDRLINTVLRLSREGRREFKPEVVDMNLLVKGICDSLAHQATAVGASVTVGELPNITSDRIALEQVFSNLVDNALKYLRQGVSGRIEIAGRQTPREVIYEVRDNGRGIDKADYQRIFELFRRAGTQDRPGEGIGLAHVRALVRRIGGSLSVASELGHGSVFTVTLPRTWNMQKDRSFAA
jgi:signal transduction histidine kinase